MDVLLSFTNFSTILDHDWVKYSALRDIKLCTRHDALRITLSCVGQSNLPSVLAASQRRVQFIPNTTLIQEASACRNDHQLSVHQDHWEDLWTTFVFSRTSALSFLAHCWSCEGKNSGCSISTISISDRLHFYVPQAPWMSWLLHGLQNEFHFVLQILV